MQGRDVQLIKKLLKNKDRKTAARINKYLKKLGKSEMEALIGIKEFICKNQMALKAVSAKQESMKQETTSSCENGYCSNIVCNFVACAWNSDCKGGACSQNGCSAAAGCYVGRISGCSGQPTCGSAACSSNSGGDCGNASCSYVSG